MNPLQRMKLNSLKKKVAKNNERRESGNAASLDQEVNTLIELARFYMEHVYDKDLPCAEKLGREAFRAAAMLGSAEAQYQVGKMMLEEGKLWLEIQESEIGNVIQNQYATNCFDEAFRYLKDAEDNEHALATRLHGMAYINGWGLMVDLDKGYRMVKTSLDLEDTWDKAPEIFQELGLNSKEFYSALGQMKKE